MYRRIANTFLRRCLSGGVAFFCALLASSICIPAACFASHGRPNIVFLMADDWSWPHAGVLGDPVIETPNFDRIAREGVLFQNAFVSTPSCTPSRLSVLTGQHHWRLQEGDSLGGSLREEFAVYTELLQDAGYFVGRTGKGVWPSKHSFRDRDSFGTRYPSFEAFLDKRPPEKPFCYWFGGRDPHRPYEYRSGANSGINLDDVSVPACLPDHEVVRSDMADYLWAVQRFDREVGQVLADLEAIAELDNTIVVVSGDNGMPFPRCKATLYDLGTRVPLAVRWGDKRATERVPDFVSLCDLAPTFLQAAGLDPPSQMTGRTLMPFFHGRADGDDRQDRTFVVTGVEQHVYRNPKRALRNRDFLYVRNFDPSGWRTGQKDGHNPVYDFAKTSWPTEPGAFSFNIDPSPTKQLLRLNQDDPQIARFARLSFAPRPEDELYDLHKDPDQLNNIAEGPEYAAVRRRLRRQLHAELVRSADPRVAIKGYAARNIQGWPVRVSDRLIQQDPETTRLGVQLLEQQLRKVRDVLPPKAFAQLRDVQIWLSPPYDGHRPKGEYHPDASWLRKEGRHPELHQSIEFSNLAIFEREVKRMPMMVLHELAHAYHNQVLGFENAEIRIAYERARDSGSYDAILRGNGKIERAYGMSNPQEYFAETTEALFGENDFYPFNREELLKHDPRMFDLLTRLWHRDPNDGQ